MRQNHETTGLKILVGLAPPGKEAEQGSNLETGCEGATPLPKGDQTKNSTACCQALCHHRKLSLLAGTKLELSEKLGRL